MAGFRHSLRVVTDQTFGSMLRSQRFANNETQTQLATRLGTRQQTVGGWERGDRPQRRFLAALAEYVNLQGGEAELLGMLDREAEVRIARGRSGVQADGPRSSAQETTDVAVQALAALVSGFAVKVETGASLSAGEVDVMGVAVQALERHLDKASDAKDL
jgi:DNA-binding XRE family transcriptional regulator